MINLHSTIWGTVHHSSQPGIKITRQTLAGAYFFLQPGSDIQKESLATAFRFTQPGFKNKNQPWPRNFFITGQGFVIKINPGYHISLRPARVAHIL